MSLGIGGKGRKIAEDKEHIIYGYSVYNLNKPECRNAQTFFDGKISIDKSVLTSPDASPAVFFNNGGITVRNCRYAWQVTTEGYDVMALAIVGKLFRQYRENGTVPEWVTIDK